MTHDISQRVIGCHSNPDLDVLARRRRRHLQVPCRLAVPRSESTVESSVLWGGWRGPV